ncbi:TadE/TadG family type IV pilus assembly protein [Chengkuizengella axinellae]|uniref:Pilus assembly protein n=1 Tax=Chengkuizengella axinellae TaxID=3064388 RepID=A0ABT9J2J4_9BACL|nr:hypothetical protein [Chengkuizengella sp. 2205SS18-9]MDP5275234.1 hypothetical protein [Chengkuizengella sp. 2205SS18-9]
MLFLQFNKIKGMIKNNKGDFIQYALAIPIVFGLIYGGVILFGVVSAKQTVGEAAWAAVREYAVSRSSGKTKQIAEEIITAHLPVNSVSSVGQESNLPNGYIQGILYKEGDHYRLNALGNLDLYVLDENLKTQLDLYINKNVSLMVKEVTMEADIDHDAYTEGTIEDTETNHSYIGESEMVSGVILDSE